jgi:hypothetical protein
VFTFDGNNIFITMNDKPKKSNKLYHFKRVKNIQKNTNCNSLFTRRSMWNSNYPGFKTSL